MRPLLVALMALMMQQDPQRLSGTIEGVINRAGTSFPIAGAQIKASTVTTGNSRPTPFAETVSDGAGRFAFREIPPGSYALEITLDGYLFGVPPGVTPTATPRLVVAPGQRAQLQVPGVQAATVRGRVVDVEDKGIPDMTVEILRLTNTQGPGRQVLQPTADIRTDDRGEYEKTMLGPGSYYVRTIVDRPDTPKTWVYFPGTTDPNSALPVELREGTDMTADIQVGPSIDVDTYRISGTVRLPVKDGPSVALILRQKPDLSGSRLFTSEGNPRTFTESQARTGRFEFRGVRKGTYDLYATVSIDGKEYLDKTVVEVRAIDVEDVDLVLRPGMDIKGRLVIDGEPRDLQLARSSSFPDDPRDENRSHVGDVKLLLGRQDGLFSESVFRPVIDDNGTSFTFPDVPPGDYEIVVSFVPDGGPPSPDLYVVDVRATGRSVFDNGFQVGADPTDAIEVIVGTKGGSIKGTVQGKPPGTPALLLLVPEPFRTSNAPFRQVPVNINAGNEFEVRGLRPGVYKLFAIPGFGAAPAQSGTPMVLYLEPEFLSQFETRGVRVSVVSVEKGTTTRGVQVPFVSSPK